VLRLGTALADPAAAMSNLHIPGLHIPNLPVPNLRELASVQSAAAPGQASTTAFAGLLAAVDAVALEPQPLALPPIAAPAPGSLAPVIAAPPGPGVVAVSAKAFPKTSSRSEPVKPPHGDRAAPPLWDATPLAIAGPAQPTAPDDVAGAIGKPIGAAHKPVVHGAAPASPVATPLLAAKADAPVVPAGVSLPGPAVGPSVSPATIQAAEVTAAPSVDTAVVPALVLPATAPVSNAGPAVTAAPSGPAPARQVAPVIIQLAQGPDGGTVTLRLDPAGLGQVQVRVERSAEGVVAVHVAVERPETLRLLVADQPQLHRALDSSGLPQEGRILTLSLASPTPAASAVQHAPAAGSEGGGGAGLGGGNGGGNGGNWRQDRMAHAEASPEFTASTGWLRAGVDITA
jgi:flagellar hook-length control protein FliK